MILDPSRFIVRYYLFLLDFTMSDAQEERLMREGVSLCSLVRTLVARTAVMALVVWFAARQLATQPLGVVVIVGGALGFVVLVGTIIFGTGYLLERIFKGKSESIALAWLRAKKARICPIVRFQETEEEADAV